jgi:hypothetical protein
MKKAVFVIVCVLGIICFSSCRSTSQSCGLANNAASQTNLQQPLLS